MNPWQDRWQSGDVTLYLGDCLEVMPTLADDSIDLVVTDPPYNIGKQYGPNVDDELPEDEYMAWYERWAGEAYRLQRAGYLYVSCSMSQIWTLRPVWERVAYSFQMLVFWHGPNYASCGSAIARQWRLLYEPIFMFLKGTRLPMLNEVRGVKTDAIIRATRPQRNFSGDLQRQHPTQKPTHLYWTLIARTPGDAVLDPFTGSGATGIACVQTGRKFIGIEIEPKYYEIAKKRISEAQMQLRMPL